ncbi:MAG: class I SAM-dependent methyltransferase [Treponema sp.]|jgi:SAM-dependent methyltransferase|nr:class I SAM-dependent methyltransferase [Treponema sp.]
MAIKTWSTAAGEEKKRPVPCVLCGNKEFKKSLPCEGFAYVRCKQCGLAQINPQPEQAEVIRRYREGSGAAYLSYELANEAAFLRLQEKALEDAGFGELETALKQGRAGEPPRVLDAGCATGALLEKLRDRGWACAGVEISPSAEYARQERGLDVRNTSLEEGRFPGASFDLVLASHLIEHLNDPAAFVREVRRVLAPGGRFLVTTPNIDGFQARLFRSRWRSAIFDHLYLFSVKTLSALLRQSGFAVERVRTWGGLAAGAAPVPVKRLADRAAKRFGFGDVMILRARRPG